jgi:hypothetical protein
MGSSGCKTTKKIAGQEESYSKPVGARVTGNSKVASFEMALAAKGAPPDDCLPMVIQAVSEMSASCPDFPLELSRAGHVSVTFETMQGRLDPLMTKSDSLDDPGVACVREVLTKAISRVPHQQRVRYLLQVRPSAG